MQVMSIEDGTHVTETVARDGCDLRFGTFCESKPCYCRASQIIERHADDTSALARLASRRAKAVRCPRPPLRRRQNDRASLTRRIKCSFERCTDWNNDASACF